jgi:hypothetical protein
MEFAKFVAQAPGTPQVIPGLFLKESALTLESHVDVPHLQKFGMINQPYDLGLLDIWARKRIADVPFMAMNLANAAVTPVNGNSYTFELTTAGDNSTRIEEDLSGSAEVGYGGQPFSLVLSNNKIGGVGSRIKFDLTSPIELEVIDRPIKRKGSHYQYTFVLVPPFTGETTVPKVYLQPGNKVYKLAAFGSREFGQAYDDWAIDGGSRQKFVNYLTTAEVQTHYFITREAARFSDGTFKDAEWVKRAKQNVLEYIGIVGAADTGITYLEDYLKLNPDTKGQRIGFQALTTLYDDIAVGLLAKECSNYMVWGSGGMTATDGLDQSIAAPGIYFQMDYSGYKHFFDLVNFDIEILEAAYRDYIRGKEVLPTLGNEPTVAIRTGRGGFQLLSAAAKKYMYADSMVGQMITNTKDLNIITGNAATGGIKFNKPTVVDFTIPMLVKFVVTLDPSLDPVDTNDLINPMWKGYRLSSYSMIMHDYNEMGASDNIKVFRPTDYGAGSVKMEVVPGSETHPFFQQNYKGMTVHSGAHLRTGFGAYFKTTPDTAIVIDPTKLLKLVPKNPYLLNVSNGL